MSLMPPVAESLLPGPLRLGWGAALGAAVVVHAGHAFAARRQRRWWHIGYTVAAGGLASMYLLPGSVSSVGSVARLVLLTALSAALVTVMLAVRSREGVLNPLWVASVVDVLAVGYLLLPKSWQPPTLSYLLLLYLGYQALAWTAGLWNHMPVAGSSSHAHVASRATASLTRTGGRAAHPAPGPDPDAHGAGHRPDVLRAPAELTVRLTLAIAAAGTGYLLVTG